MRMVLAGIGLSVLLVTFAGAAPELVPSPIPSAAPSPLASEGPAIVGEKVDRKELNVLRTQFLKAQRSEFDAVVHRHAFELREIQASQGARRKEWESKEKAARHKFFAEHTAGPERRAFVKDFVERRKSFLAITSDERSKRVQDQDVRIKSMREERKTKRI